MSVESVQIDWQFARHGRPAQRGHRIDAGELPVHLNNATGPDSPARGEQRGRGGENDQFTEWRTNR
jgi:hypothetical protein